MVNIYSEFPLRIDQADFSAAYTGSQFLKVILNSVNFHLDCPLLCKLSTI